MSGTLATRLGELMSSGGWTYRRLAAKVRVSPASISSWRSGDSEPVASNVAALARALGVSSDYLLGLGDAADRAAKEAREQAQRDIEAMERGIEAANRTIDRLSGKGD